MRPGYYVDSMSELWVVYPDGRHEYLNEFDDWVTWMLHPFLIKFFHLEFMGDL